MQRLSVDKVIPELKAALVSSGAAVLSAPPGAGKSTRVPLALLDEMRDERGRIIVLEPRRIAAVSVARWMAHLIGEQVGETVGYAIRFDRRISIKTRIEVVTEGILTRRMQTDPELGDISLVIFDEFHERSINADLALALCLDVRRSLREDLGILVMSATLDCSAVSSLLDNAPVITSGGMEHPVDMKYPAVRDGRSSTAEQVAESVLMALRETSGDILAFLPGSGEIRACGELLLGRLKGGAEGTTVCPLYGDLPFEEQERAIMPSEKRRVVLATNIAETSLTIEGIGVVIDSGLTRSLRYDPSTGMNRLITLNVSKASAEQRKGRAGRLGPGTCYRLYSEHAFRGLLPFSPPEVLVSDLSSLVLELALWGVKNPSQLSWLDVPPDVSVESARELLRQAGAVDGAGAITPKGKKIASFPLHPRLGSLMVRAEELDDAGLGTDIAALLSERDIIRRSSAASGEYDVSELVDLLRSWRRGERLPSHADQTAVRAVERTARHLLELIGCKGEARNTEPCDHRDVSRLLLSAFPDRIAMSRGDRSGRFLLRQGRGMKLPAGSKLAGCTFLVAVAVDAGGTAEGKIHQGQPLDEEIIREECGGGIETVRRVEWDRRDRRIIAVAEEKLGALVLASKHFQPTDGECIPHLCDAVKVEPGLLGYGRESLQFMGRVGLMRRAYPGEEWPDISQEYLSSHPENWLIPWLNGIRTARQLAALDLLPALRGLLDWKQQSLLDERAPAALTVPSRRKVKIDYASGELPVLAVKLQEMFGLPESPSIAGGRVGILIHLLSPAGRPVQITQDLKGFWTDGYQQVKKELKGRYPKHPWPDDPWNAVPTGKTKKQS